MDNNPPIDEDVFEDNPSRFKWAKYTLSIFLILLLLSYFLLSYPLYPIIGSLFESQLIENETIILDGNRSLVFLEDTYPTINELYHKNQSVEFVACLLGQKLFNKYEVNEIQIPSIISQSFNQVIFKSCPSNKTIALIHSHPYRRCIASERDIETLDTLKKQNEDMLLIIMCEPSRFSIY